MSDRSRSLSRCGLAGSLPHRCGYRIYSLQVRMVMRRDYRWCGALLANLKIAYSVVREPILSPHGGGRRRDIAPPPPSLSLRAVTRKAALFFSRAH